MFRDAGQMVPHAFLGFVLLDLTMMLVMRRAAIGFLGVWFCAILAPASSIMPLAGQARDYDKAIALKPDLAAPYYNRAMAQAMIKADDQAWAGLRAYRSLGGIPHPGFLDELPKSPGRSE